uniref:Uncharacterized protein n=1 Tax=Panagrolaimus superbus TaxID=310955 RepID=A0A914YIW6_9BILA
MGGTLTGFGDMTQVLNQAIRHINGSMSQTRQGMAQAVRRPGLFQGWAAGSQTIRVRSQSTLQEAQGNVCRPQRPRQPDVVTSLSRTALQGLPHRDFTQHRNADDHPLLAARGITTDQGALRLIGQFKQTFGECGQPLGPDFGHGQSQKAGSWLGPHGAQVRQVHGQRLVPQEKGVHIGKEMLPFDQ